ncbi:MAG: hypothetical protein MI757_08060, partial [Pirellulales bacterium]|nr:hypothetical protein [Pirellulales bacterium]
MNRFSWCPFARIGLILAAATVALPTAHAQQNAKPLPTRTATGTALWYGVDADGRQVGGTSTVKITVGGAPAGAVRIGFFEDEVGGSGNNWRAAGWAAATTAAQISEFNPYATQVSYDIGGFADGPSGGGLMTVGVLAAIRGDKIRSDAAMTGTINADGIIGPVGGIAYKIEGAAAAGKKLVVIPRGMDHEYHAGKKAKVNLVEHGRSLGVDVRPVLDIYTAYALMTGKELPRPKLYAPPTVPAAAEAVLRRRIDGWKDRLMHAVKTYDDLPADCKPEAVKTLMNKAVELVNRAAKLTNEGEFAAGYIDLFFANYNAYMGMEFGRNLFEYNRRGVAGAVTRIRKNSWLQDEINDVTELIETYEPKTFDQLSMYILACEAYFEALCCQQLAKDAIAMIPRATDAFKENLTLAAATWQIIAWLDLKLASNYMSMARTYGGRPIPANAPVWQLAAFYKKSYEANVNVLDHLYITNAAKKRGVSKDEFKCELAYNDIHFGIITM